MPGNQPDDDRERCTADQTQGVTLEDILALEEGDAIAVRTIFGDLVEIFAGRVDASPPSMDTIENKIEEYASVGVLSVDTNLWWALEDGQINQKGHEIDELPPYQKAMGEPLSDPPLCSLDYSEDDGVLFTVPVQVYNSRRVHHYARDAQRPVVALESGAIVDPEKLLPETYAQN